MNFTITQQTKDKVADVIRDLNLETGGDSLMGSGSLYQIENYGNEVIVDGIIAEEAGNPVGWAVAFDNGESHVYVAPSKRKMGLGTQLVREIEKLVPESQFCPWNSDTKKFFTELGVKLNYYHM